MAAAIIAPSAQQRENRSPAKETVRIRPVHPNDFEEINRLIRPMGYNDSAHVYRLCYSAIDAMYWVCTNDRGEIVAFDSVHRLTMGNQTILFGLIKAVARSYQGYGLSKQICEMYSHQYSSWMGDMSRMGFTTCRGRKKFGKKTVMFRGQPRGNNIHDQQQVSDVKIHELDDDHEMDELITYDRTVFNYDRSAYVRAWCNNSKPNEQYSRTLVARDRDNRVVGYGTIRLLEESYAIQPLYADQDHVAETILKGLVRLHERESAQNRLPIVFYAFAENRPMMQFASSNNLEMAGSWIRTYVETDQSSVRDATVEFQAEAIDKLVNGKKVYCTQIYWPA